MKKRYKIPLSVVVVFMLAVAVTILIVIKTDFLENRANEFLRMAVERKYDLKISLGDIGGSILSDINVSDISVRYGEGDNEYTIASIDYIEAEYSLWQIIRQRWNVDRLLIDSLNVRLRKKPGGSLDLPDFGSDSGSDADGNGGDGIPDFRLNNFTLTSGSFKIVDSEDSVFVDNIGFLLDAVSDDGIVQSELRTFFGNAKSYGLALRSLSGLITITDSVIVAEEMRAVVDSSVFVFESEIQTSDGFGISADFDTAQVDINRLSDIAGVGIKGNVTFDGNVQFKDGRLNTDIIITGEFLDWHLNKIRAVAEFENKLLKFNHLVGGAFGGRLDGSGRIDFGVSPNEYYYTGRIRDVNLDEIVDGTFESSFSGSIDLSGSSFKNDELTLDIDAHLNRGKFDQYTYDSLAGSMLVTTDSIRFRDPVLVTYKSTTVRAGGLIEYSGDIKMKGTADLPIIDEFRNQIFLEDIGGRGTAKFELYGPIVNPNVSGTFSSDSVQVYDFTSHDFLAFLDINEFFTDPRGDVEIYSEDYDYSGLPGQSLYSYMTVTMDSVRIPEFETRMDPFDIQARGLLRIGEDTIKVELFSADSYVDTQLIAIDSNALITFLDSSITLDSVTVLSDGGSISLAGTYNYDETIDISFNADSVSIVQWLPYVFPGYYLTGYLFADGIVNGSLQYPVIGLDLSTRDLLYEDQPVGEIKSRIEYSDKQLRFEDFRIVGENNQTRAFGLLPIDLAFESREKRIIEDDSLHFDIEVSGTNFDLATVFFEDVEWFNGRFDLDVNAFGTYNDMRFSGTAEIENGDAKVYQLANPIEDLSVNARFEQRKLRIEKLVGTMRNGKKTGHLWVDGDVNLEDLSMPDYDLQIYGDNLPIIYDLGMIEATIDTMTIYVEGSNPPFAEGDIELARFWYAEPFYTNVRYEALAAADTGQGFDYRLDISVPQNMWIENDEADLELGGDLIIIKDGKNENFLGKLETIRGRITLTQLNRTFTVVSGGEILFDNVEEFNPSLNIQLTTTIRDSTGIRDVCMEITQTLENPHIDVCEDSDVSIEEALAFLNPLQGALGESTASDTVSANSSLASKLSVGAAGIAINQAARYFAQSLGVETLEINPSLSGSKVEADLTVGFYYNPRLYIYGSSQTSAQYLELGFDYRISKHVFLSGQRDRDNLYHLNLNLNWEFE